MFLYKISFLGNVTISCTCYTRLLHMLLRFKKLVVSIRQQVECGLHVPLGRSPVRHALGGNLACSGNMAGLGDVQGTPNITMASYADLDPSQPCAIRVSRALQKTNIDALDSGTSAAWKMLIRRGGRRCRLRVKNVDDARSRQVLYLSCKVSRYACMADCYSPVVRRSTPVSRLRELGSGLRVCRTRRRDASPGAETQVRRPGQPARLPTCPRRK